MEGFSIITYKNKEIQYTDYSRVGDSKEKTLQLFNYVLEQLPLQPPKTILSLVNFTNFHVDKNILEMYNSKGPEMAYVKKIAVFGLKGIVSLAYGIFINVIKDYPTDIKVFNSEEEAKEWLVSDEPG